MISQCHEKFIPFDIRIDFLFVSLVSHPAVCIESMCNKWQKVFKIKKAYGRFNNNFTSWEIKKDGSVFCPYACVRVWKSTSKQKKTKYGESSVRREKRFGRKLITRFVYIHWFLVDFIIGKINQNSPQKIYYIREYLNCKVVNIHRVTTHKFYGICARKFMRWQKKSFTSHGENANKFRYLCFAERRDESCHKTHTNTYRESVAT